ncbi:gliding motility-associated C-terminal domain-containing protein [Flavobacterium reichenbachii]|uniref:Uncharacterized protein n=1 Tax=Flavobacterium reichenbachii TaxID=362418 RepID=A0A085ZNY2_9FLAO|nr:T9SS C-terminal target domain-containing protein [Flavobacterium reichenbachii]KFF06146.1 hypothetical protein IW19_11660 [Flavobacterium reichenbachii]OXB17632.1 T9SS C-terminal target domain-containing protein [Flavobacterium reichenbachii]
MVKNYYKFLHIILFFAFFSILPSKIYGQCAGQDNIFTVCDIHDTSSQTINLFALLGGTPQLGGVWTDDDKSGGLNLNTGNLNAQVIRRSGVYHYTYTVTSGGCTDNSATIEVTVGGYSGIGSRATVCSSQLYFNLFQAFSGVDPPPQINGHWHNDTTNENLPDSSFYIKGLQGNYYFTYTMDAIGSCPAQSSQIIVSVSRAPEAGEAGDLTLCGDNDLTPYTNFDLFSLISGQDPGGFWRDDSGTGEIVGIADHNIDIQKIYTSYGAQTYNFTYVVPSPNPTVCPVDEETVQIILQKKLDFTGATVEVTSDICETEIPTATYFLTINKNTAVIPDGTYLVSYNVSGPRGGTRIDRVAFVNGVLRFQMNSSYFQQVGTFRVTILNIYGLGIQACQNIIGDLHDDLIISPNPDLQGARIDPVTTCQNKDVLVTISNALKLADGDYDIVYNIRGANSSTARVARITSVGGVSSFVIPGNLLAVSGTSVVTITAITHVSSQCVSSALLQGNILINPLPNTTALRIQIPDDCFGKTFTASVTGLGSLTDVTLSYTLSGSNTSTVQTIVLPVTNGNASFTIPSSLLLNTGSTTINVTNLKNNITTCDVNVSGISDPFLLNPIPAAPLASNQVFCKAEDKTIANLEPIGAQYKWYISAVATTPLAANYVLKSENYFIRETSSAGCTSEPAMILVTINDIPAPILNSDGPNFCGLDNPTILDLVNRTNSRSSVVWYDAEVNGNLLPPSTPLIDKRTYYGFDFSSNTGCFSDENTAVTVSLTDCDSPDYPFFIPDGFSPNGDGVNDSFVIPDIDFLYPDYTIEIFNRYGNGMYKGKKDKPAWDGMNYEAKGVGSGIAPNGVYFYIINFNKDNKPPKQGRLYLNR